MRKKKIYSFPVVAMIEAKNKKQAIKKLKRMGVVYIPPKRIKKNQEQDWGYDE